MTFSFRPYSLSTLPLVAAAISTRVVSWKEAAVRNESVLKQALVMPSSSWMYLAGFLPSCDQCFVGFDDGQLTDDVAGNEFAVAGFFDLNAAEHLADDDFKVLVGDVLALAGKDLQDFVHDVALSGFDALQAHQLVQVDRTVGQALAGYDFVAVFDHAAA